MEQIKLFTLFLIMTILITGCLSVGAGEGGFLPTNGRAGFLYFYTEG
jgi:hypothetical protein